MCLVLQPSHPVTRNMLPLLLILIGGAPRKPYRKEPNGDVRDRVSLVGVFFVLLHCFLNVFCVYLSDEEERRDPERYRENNNIMRGVVALQRLVSLAQEPALALCSWYQAKSLCVLLDLVQEVDEYVEGAVEIKGLVRRLRNTERVVALVILLSALANLTILMLLYRKYYEEDAGLHDLYSSILPAVNYLVHVSLTCTQLFSICMRWESYSLLLQGFFTRVHAVQEEIHLRGMQKKWGLRTLIDGISQG